MAAKNSRTNIDQKKLINPIPPEPNECDSAKPCDHGKPTEKPDESEDVSHQDSQDPRPRDQKKSTPGLAPTNTHFQISPENPKIEPVDLLHQDPQESKPCDQHKPNMALTEASPAYPQIQMDAVKPKDEPVDKDPEDHIPCYQEKLTAVLTEATQAILHYKIDPEKPTNKPIDLSHPDPQANTLFQMGHESPKDEPVDLSHKDVQDPIPCNQEKLTPGFTEASPAIPHYKIDPDEPLDLSHPDPQANTHFPMGPENLKDEPLDLSYQNTKGLAKASPAKRCFQMDLDYPTDEPLDLSLKNPQDPKPQDLPLDLSHPKRNKKELLKKQYLATRNLKPLGPPPEPHFFSMSTSKWALINLGKACAEKKPSSQLISNDLSDPGPAASHSNNLKSQDGKMKMDPVDHVLPISTPNLENITSWQAFADEKPISQPDTDDALIDLLSDPGCPSSHSSYPRSQDGSKKLRFSCLRQLDLPPKKDEEPEASLSTLATEQVPDSKEDYMRQWLLAVNESSLSEDQNPKECEEELKPLIEFPDSDEEELADGTNPFANDMIDAQDPPKLEVLSAEQAEERMDDYIKRLRFRVAIPECCLTDDISRVDRPSDAVVLGQKLPTLRLLDNCKEKDFIEISVCKVYSPFQFWFHFVNQTHDTGMLDIITRDMNTFYNHKKNPKYSTPVSSYYLKAGYICAANHRNGWRRARILITPPKDAEWVSIYYVDYASAAEVSPDDLKFLPEFFADTPILAARGTLSHIHPLDIHWPQDSTQQFRRLVFRRHVHAHVVELDAEEGILFMRLSQNKDFKPSINRKLVDAKLAGESKHYTQELIKYNCGRRLRYLRERLPSFEILEARLIPLKDEEFEIEFDDIIYSPSFYKHYQLPKLTNPFLSRLLEALAAWMPGYRKDQEHWCRIYREANKKIREKALERQKTALERYDKMVAERDEKERQILRRNLKHPKTKREFMLFLQLRAAEGPKKEEHTDPVEQTVQVNPAEHGVEKDPQDRSEKKVTTQPAEEKDPENHKEETDKELQAEENEPEDQKDEDFKDLAQNKKEEHNAENQNGEMESPEEADQKHPGLKENEHQKKVVESKEEVDQKDPAEKKEEIQSKEDVHQVDPEERNEHQEEADSKEEVDQRDLKEKNEEIQSRAEVHQIDPEEKKENQEEVDSRDNVVQRDHEKEKNEVGQRDPEEENEEIQSKEEIDPMDPEEKKMEPPTEEAISKENQRNPEEKYEEIQSKEEIHQMDQKEQRNINITEKVDSKEEVYQGDLKERTEEVNQTDPEEASNEQNQPDPEKEKQDVQVQPMEQEKQIEELSKD